MTAEEKEKNGLRVSENARISNGTEVKAEKPYKMEIVWRNVIIFIVMHYFAVQIFFFFKWPQFWFHYVYGFIAAFGVPVGAHRLWAHRSFKANYKFQVLLMIFQTIAIQNDVIEWVRDHRVHHKFADTDADPSNSKRGFFFSHIGWLMCKKHPDVRRLGAKIYMEDIESDPLLQFQRRHYGKLVLFFSFALPMIMVRIIWGDSLYRLTCSVLFRYLLSLHLTWLTNSVAHMGSWKPYDKNIAASDSKINGTVTFGEGWHNFHHTFPFDYKVSELPLYRHNIAMGFIDFFAWIGWATDLKTASDDMVKKRVLRTGDGSHPYAIEMAKKMKIDENSNLINAEDVKRGSEVYWGLGDKDIPEADLRDIAVLCATKSE